MTINSKSFDTFEELSQELDLIGFMSAYTNIPLSEINTYIKFDNIEFGGSSLTQETSANGELNCNNYIFYTSTTPTNIKILNTGENNIQDFKCKFLILEID